jgi:hypothetical protein
MVQFGIELGASKPPGQRAGENSKENQPPTIYGPDDRPL